MGLVMTRSLRFVALTCALVACNGSEDDVPEDRDAGSVVRDGGSVVRDAGSVVRDAGPVRDAGARDGGVIRDAGERDGGERDGGDRDGGSRDGGERDGGVERDAGPRDGGPRDGGPRDAGFVCGDGTLDPGEDCDDGNTTDDGNGCSTICTRVGSCGDGTVQSLFEVCDGEACCDASCAMAAPPSTICRASAFDCDAEEVCDGTGFDCPADVAALDGATCDDCTAGSGLCAACLDGACADRPYFCADLLTATPTAADGVYAINAALTPTTGTTLEMVYCDMTGGGWTMVHKKSRLAPGDAGAMWTSGATNASDLALLDRQLTDQNYTSALVGTAWSSFTEARVEILTGTVVQRFMEFDTTGSDLVSWFAADRHTASNWIDLPTDPNWTNNNGRYFTIEAGARDWYVNLQWGGCPSDRGWLMITRGNFCYWEATTGDPVEIIYSVLDTHGSAPSSTQTAFADSFVVFVR